MIVPRATLPAIALLVAMTTVAIGFYGGIGQTPRAFFGGGDAVVLGPPDEVIPGRGQVAVALVGPLRALPFVGFVSPEIYVLSSLDGRSVLVRGVDFGVFPEWEGARLADGRWPAADGEAAVGRPFADAFGVAPGSRMVLPSSLARTALVVEVVGVVEAGRVTEDEVLVGLRDARLLANLDEGAVHVIRTQTTERDNLTALLGSVQPEFTYSDVRVSSSEVVPGETAYVRANLTNWGMLDGAKVVQVREGDRVLAEATVVVPARATVPVEVPFRIDAPGPTNITVNPTIPLRVRLPDVRVVGVPAFAVAQQPFHVLVEDGAGPVEDVEVRLGRFVARTNGDGLASVVPEDAGRRPLTFWRNGTLAWTGDVLVIPPERAARPHGVVTAIQPPAEVLGVHHPAKFLVRVENQGGQGGEVEVDLTRDGEVVATHRAYLPAGAATDVEALLGPFEPGDHVIGAAGSPVAVRVRTYPGWDPRVEALLELYERGGANAPPPPVDESGDGYVEEILGDVSVAVATLSVASGALAALGVVATLARRIAERAPSIGLLKAIGASDGHVLAVAAREAAALGALGALGGIPLGILAARLLDATGFVRAFGHAVHPTYAWNALALQAILTIGFVSIAARFLVRAHLDRAPDALLRGAPLRADVEEPPTLESLTGAST